MGGNANHVLAGQVKTFPQNIYVASKLIRVRCVPRPYSFLTGWFMTHRQDVTCGREVAARWCALAEQRLEHLTEMFETGRWRRYYSEIAFLENIQEAKRALQTWRSLAAGEDVPALAPSGPVPLGWSPATLVRSAPTREQVQVQTVQPTAVHIAAETSVRGELDTMASRLAEIVEATTVPSAEPPSAVPERIVEFTFSLDGIEARYPLLRNAF